MGTFFYRVMGAAMLDASMYEGIEGDPRATRQALGVVLLASLAAGLGAAGIDGPRWTTLLGVAAVALIAWLAWAGLILQIGARYLPGRDTSVTIGELLRTVGFSASPGLLLILAAIVSPALVFITVAIWMIAAMIVAIRQALDYHSTVRAAAVSLVALGIIALLVILLGVLLGPTLS